MQEMSLADGCVYTNIVQHEFMHALGIEHEQNRHDRDNYITVTVCSIHYCPTTSNKPLMGLVV